MSRLQAKILLLCVFIARGTSFLFSKTLMAGMSPETVLAIRFSISFLVLAVIFHKRLLRCSAGSLKGGLLLGVLYSVCMFFEMHGLRLIDSGVSSFIENMAIVLVPVYMALLTRTMPKRKTMVCCLMAIVGVGFLSLSQMSRGVNRGILLTVLAAMTYGVCIIVTKRVSEQGDPLTIGMIQLGVMGGCYLLISVVSGGFRMPADHREWGMLLMLALICSCFGFAFQPIGQKYLPAETAAVFTVVNPLTASILGVLVAHESMGAFKLIGYVLILAALVWYNLTGESTIGRERLGQDFKD